MYFILWTVVINNNTCRRNFYVLCIEKYKVNPLHTLINVKNNDFKTNENIFNNHNFIENKEIHNIPVQCREMIYLTSIVIDQNYKILK